MSRLRIMGEFAAVRWLRPWRSRAAIERRQRRLLRRHLRFLRRRSAYFAPLLCDPRTPLSALPLMDKGVMMANFDALSTVGANHDRALALALVNERSRDFAADLGGCSVGLSSGTSGHRGLFVVSRAEREAWAGAVLARTLPRGRLLGHRIALFLRADNTLYETVASRAVAFAYFDLAAEFTDNVARLQDFRPSILVAPPSVLRELGRAASEGRFDAFPEKVYSVAEVLEERDAARIRETLRQPVLHQLYQCTEGFLAHSCEHGTIHLNEDIVLFEREELGERRFVPIVTDLRRRAQPIVRYRMGDILRERADACPCGSALTAVERVEGREGDTLLLPDTEGNRIPVFADLLGRALLYAEGFTGYQVVQTGPERLEVSLADAEEGAPAAVEAELRTLLARLGCAQPEIRFTPYREEPGKKLRRVRRAEEGDHAGV